MENRNLDFTTIYTTLGIGLIFIFVWKLLTSNKQKTSSNDLTIDDETVVQKAPSESKKTNKSKSKIPKRSISAPKFKHDLLHTTLKGHTGVVTCLESSLNGKYLASCSEDQSIRLWSVKDFGNGNKSVRVNVQFDCAKKIRFSPDNRAFIVGLSGGNTVRVYRLGKKEETGTTTCVPLEDDFPTFKNANLLNIGVGSSANGGSFVMTAYQDTTIIIRNLKGEVLHTINTNQGNNNCALVSPCGRYVASSGWTPDVKVWSINFTKTGDFKDVTRAFELDGHTSSVWSFAFSLDSSKMITVSKDGCWRLFDTQREHGFDPYIITRGAINITDVSFADTPCVVALSADGLVAAVAALNHLIVFSTTTGKVEMEAREVHSEVISSLTFDIGGRYILSTGDKYVRVFHNILNYKEKIKSFEKSLGSSIPSAMRERQEKLLQECKKSLQKILSQTQNS